MVTLSAPSSLRLHRGIDRGHAAADDHHVAPDRQPRQVGDWRKLGDEIHRVA